MPIKSGSRAIRLYARHPLWRRGRASATPTAWPRRWWRPISAGWIRTASSIYRATWSTFREGYIQPAARPAIVRETPTSALVTGNWTFGHVAAKYAAEVAIEKARKQNVAVAGIVEAHHIGRLGEYVELAAANGMIGMVWAGGQSEETPHAVPYGGRQRVLHTNPLAVGFPAGDGPPIMFDFSTTAVAGVKVIFAHEHNEPLPPRQYRGQSGPADHGPGGLLRRGWASAVRWAQGLCA